MKKLTIIAASLLGVVILLFLLLLVFRSVHPAPAPVTGGNTQFPVSSSTPTGSVPSSDQHMTVATSDGGSIVVNNFLKNGTTIPDPENQGVFYLAGSLNYCLPDGTCPTAAPADGFVVTYNSSGQSFTVILTKEPLSDSRRKAQAFLISALGLTSSQLCQLSSYVGTVNAVNETYSGTNLGFSGCQGATVLP